MQCLRALTYVNHTAKLRDSIGASGGGTYSKLRLIDCEVEQMRIQLSAALSSTLECFTNREKIFKCELRRHREKSNMIAKTLTKVRKCRASTNLTYDPHYLAI